MHQRSNPLIALLVSSATLVACGSESPSANSAEQTVAVSETVDATTSAEPVVDPGDGGNYAPEIDPANFVDVIDNTYLPMPVGAHWRYEGTSDGEVETVDVTVTGERKTIEGVSTFVIRDTVTVGGELVEDTYDWFAQDIDGNVWYFGEDVRNFANGQLADTDGSWEAGIDGAFPGIVMPAVPAAGDAYRQEFLAGEAEDMMEITSVGDPLTVAAGTFDDVVGTRDWTPIEPDTIEEKAYAAGVGKLREEKVAGGNGFAELVEYDLGG